MNELTESKQQTEEDDEVFLTLETKDNSVMKSRKSNNKTNDTTLSQKKLAPVKRDYNYTEFSNYGKEGKPQEEDE